MRTKFQPIDIDKAAVDAMWNIIHPVSQTTYTTVLETPITQELTTALKAAARHKSPDIGGISLDFYTAN
jgi:hypothetical protein